MSRVSILVWTFFLATALGSVPAAAAVPTSMVYQGRLTDSTGDPITSLVQVTFTMYDPGGSVLWTEQNGITPDNQGFFTVELGLSQPFTQTMFDGNDRQLGIKVGTDAEMTPRQVIAAVPYAMVGGLLPGSVGSLEIADGSITADDVATDIVSSVDGVSNDGGDIDFLAGSTAITITPNDAANTITFDVTGGGGSVTSVTAGNGLTATPNPITGAGTISVPQNGIDTVMIAPRIVSSVEGVTNDGGDIDLIEGNGITIAGDDVGNTIQIDAAADGNSLDASDGGPVDVVTVDPDGLVGIGTNKPSAQLQVVGGSSKSLQTTSTTSDAALQSNNAGAGPAIIASNTGTGVAISGYAAAGDLMQLATGLGNVRFRVSNVGNVTADGTFIGGSADFAEMIDVGGAQAEAGDVMVIDPTNSRAVRLSDEPGSRLVAGIYSTEPGFIGRERAVQAVGTVDPGSRGPTEIPLAITGIVPCKVSAENGPIRPGDLLVTAETPGHAMREDHPEVGTVLGKALGSLESGTGTIRVLVTLQ